MKSRSSKHDNGHSPEPLPPSIIKPYILKIHLNVILPFLLSLPSESISRGFPTKILHADLYSSIRAIYLALCSLLNFTVLRILDKGKRKVVPVIN
jgi:hypothetical protein